MDSSTQPRFSRLGWACDRCRRQKLKCDVEKPCLLCVRAGATCEPQSSTAQHASPWKKRKRSVHSAADVTRRPHEVTATTTPVTADPTQHHRVLTQNPTTPSCSSISARTPTGDHHFAHPTTSSLHFDHDRPGSSLDVTSAATVTSPDESRQYGANDSTMGFAKFILGEDDDDEDDDDHQHHPSKAPATSGTIPGDARHDSNNASTPESLLPGIFPTTRWPSPAVLQVAVDAYFDRVNWYILLFHQPSFVARTRSIVRRLATTAAAPAPWSGQDGQDVGVCDVLLVATVAALGLRCVQHDPTWKGHDVLKSYSVTAGSLVADLMSQIGAHFYEVMLESRIEAYQICMLLTTYHVYFGSSNFAWNVSGVSGRTAYALALHCDQARRRSNDATADEIAREVGNRCWNHLVVSDQFSSMIFGRPAQLDPAFAQFRKLAEMDDTRVPSGTLALPVWEQDHAEGRPALSFLTYHNLKFELYHIIRQTLQSFRVLQLPSPVSVRDLKAFIQVVHTTDLMLKQWHEKLPAVFQPYRWSEEEEEEEDRHDHDHLWNNVLELDRCPPEERAVRRKIGLQGFILQLLYDAAIVWANRPLLKLRISLSPARDKLDDDLPDSLGTSVRAALRMSRVPVHEFEGHLAQSFVLMHLFTAGIILCVAPTCQPYTPMAAEAKAGVLRIIAACRAIDQDASKIARHTDQMLTRLYKKTMEREMENALRGVSDVAGVPKSQDRRIPPTLHGHHDEVDPDHNDDHHPQQQQQQSHRESNALPSQLNNVTAGPAAAMQPAVTTPVWDHHHLHHLNRADDVPGEPVVSYLQFESFHHHPNPDHRMDFHVDDHMDEAYGAFEQMFNLDLGDFPFQNC